MRIHPIAKLLPELPEPQLKALADDIKANGLHEPVTIWKGMILDGRNRAKACKIAGVTLATIDAIFKTKADAAKFVISMNITRRHLTDRERTSIAVELEKLFAEDADDRKKAGHKKGGKGKGKSAINSPPSSKSEATADAADAINAKPGNVRKAKALKKNAVPELYELWQQEKVSTDAATKVSKLSWDEQDEIVKGGADAVKAKAKEIREAAKPKSEPKSSPIDRANPEPKPDVKPEEKSDPSAFAESSEEPPKEDLKPDEAKPEVPAESLVEIQCEECGEIVAEGEECGCKKAKAETEDPPKPGVDVERRHAKPDSSPVSGPVFCASGSCENEVDPEQCIATDTEFFCSLKCVLRYRNGHQDWKPTGVRVVNAAGDFAGFMGAIDLPIKKFGPVLQKLESI